jgi:hypothetical protein
VRIAEHSEDRPVSATPELVAAGSSRQAQSIVISTEFQAESAAQFLISTELDGRMSFFTLRPVVRLIATETKP